MANIYGELTILNGLNFNDGSLNTLIQKGASVGDIILTLPSITGTIALLTDIPATPTTLYNGDSSLSGDRIVTMGANSLSFSGNTTTFKGADVLKTTRTAQFVGSDDINLLTIWNDGHITQSMTVDLGSGANWNYGLSINCVNNEPSAFMGGINVSVSGTNAYGGFFNNDLGFQVELSGPSMAGFFGKGNKMCMLGQDSWAAQFNIWTSPATVYIGSDSIGIQINGAGITSATSGLIIQNSASTELFRVRDDGAVISQQGYWQGAAKILYVNPNATTANVFAGEDSGNATMTGSYNAALGRGTLSSNTTGIYNTAIGYGALLGNTIGISNTSIGSSSMSSNSTGSNNIGIGNNVLYSLISGNENIAIGQEALNVGTTENYNTAIGFKALNKNNADYNSAFGWMSSVENTTGTNNVSIGAYSLTTNSVGSNSVAIGYAALNNTTVGNQVAIGYQALTANTTGLSNTAIGFTSLATNTAGAGNTAVGNATLTTNSVGNHNTAIGNNALNVNTVSSNTAVGSNALVLTTTGGFNTAIGHGSSSTNVDGASNIAIGYNTFSTNVSGNYNVAIGNNALALATVSGLVAIGYNSLATNTIGLSNTAVGYNSLTANLSGNQNTAVGNNTLQANTTGFANVAIGTYAMKFNTIGQYNTAIGDSSLQNNTNGVGNSGVGSSVMFNNTTGQLNTAFGNTALYNNVSGDSNVAIGDSSLFFSTVGNLVAIGQSALFNNTTGTQNTGVGYNTGFRNSVGTDNTSLGYSTLFENKASSYNTAFGSNVMYYTGATILTGSFVVGVSYTIDVVGDTDFTLIGAASNTIGVVFTATGVGGGTTGYAYPTAANNNTGMGYNALYNNINGNGNVAIGYQAGYYGVTEDNSLYIHNGLGVTDLATGKTNSLIYGVFDVNSSNQSINFNSQVFIRHDVTLYGEQDHLFGVMRPTIVASPPSSGFDLTLYAGGAIVGGTDLNGGDYITKSGISTGNGSADVIVMTPTPTSTGTGDNTPVAREKIYTRYMLDNDTFTLESARSGMGWLMAGDGEEYAWFIFTSAGAVTLVNNSAGVTIAGATNNSINIYNGGTAVVIKNTFTAAKVVTVKVIYNT